jgi:hypothetical protein
MGGPYCAPGDGESVGLGPHCAPGIIASDCVGIEPHRTPVNGEGVRSGAGDGESGGLGPHCAPGIIASDCVGFEPHRTPVNGEGVRSGSLPAGRAAEARGVDGGGRREEASQASQLRWAVGPAQVQTQLALWHGLRAVQDRRARQAAYGKGGALGRGGGGRRRPPVALVAPGQRAAEMGGPGGGRSTHRHTACTRTRTANTPIWRRSRWKGRATGNRGQLYGGGGADAGVARPVAAQAGRPGGRRNMGQGVQSSVRRLPLEAGA